MLKYSTIKYTTSTYTVSYAPLNKSISELTFTCSNSTEKTLEGVKYIQSLEYRHQNDTWCWFSPVVIRFKDLSDSPSASKFYLSFSWLLVAVNSAWHVNPIILLDLPAYLWSLVGVVKIYRDIFRSRGRHGWSGHIEVIMSNKQWSGFTFWETFLWVEKGEKYTQICKLMISEKHPCPDWITNLKKLRIIWKTKSKFEIARQNLSVQNKILSQQM